MLLSNVRDLLGPSDDDIGTARILGAIKESVSALEAFLNEIEQLGFGYKQHNHPETHLLVRLASQLAAAEEAKKSITEKVVVAHQTLSGRTLKKGATPCFQKLVLLVHVRNELTHPKASVVDISSLSKPHSKREQKILSGLRSHGFMSGKDRGYDWFSAIEYRSFGIWAYLTVLENIEMILSEWPYDSAIESFEELYGVHYRDPSQWT